MALPIIAQAERWVKSWHVIQCLILLKVLPLRETSSNHVRALFQLLCIMLRQNEIVCCRCTAAFITLDRMDLIMGRDIAGGRSRPGCWSDHADMHELSLLTRAQSHCFMDELDLTDTVSASTLAGDGDPPFVRGTNEC